MPVNRPRRVRIIVIIIVMGPRALVKLNAGTDNSVDELTCYRLAKVQLMFFTTVETNWTAAQINVDAKFTDLANYIESFDDPDEINEETLATKSGALQIALTAAGM